jgi:multidrug efflux pump subunit AcrB
MTSFVFILAVAPLAVATGAGAEMRETPGTAVLFGMLAVTVFGLLFSSGVLCPRADFSHKERA